MNQKKKLDFSGLNKALEKAAPDSSRHVGLGALKDTLKKVDYESIPKAPMLPVAPADFEPKNKADRRRIPARVRATFEGKRTREA